MNLGKHVVSKFGGSSVKDALAIKRSANIVARNLNVGIVVISATQHTTNHLEELCINATLGHQDQVKNLFNKIWDRHKEIAKDLDVADQGTQLLDELEREIWPILNDVIKNKSYQDNELDHLYSFGERISSALFSFYLAKILPGKKVELVPATSLLKTGNEFRRAQPHLEKIAECCEKLLGAKLKAGKTVFVTQGFVGQSPNGEFTTLGREGSDYSAALLGEGSLSAAVEIWTDVAGVATADPRIISSTKMIPEMSYKEATVLARLGAKVLFSETLLPAERKKIPVFVGSSLNPELGGTWISTDTDHSWNLVGVALMDEMSFYRFEFNQKSNIDWSSLYPLFFKQDKNAIEFYLPKRRALSASLIQRYKESSNVTILANQSVISMVGRYASGSSFKERLFAFLSSKFATSVGPVLISDSDFSLSFSWKEVDSLELLRASHDFLIEINHN